MPTDPRVAQLPGFVLLREKLPRLHEETERLVAASSFGLRPSGPALDQIATFIEPDELAAFTAAVDLFYEKHPWPRTTVISLLQNPRLPRKELLDGDRFPTVYRNAVQQMDEILQYKHLWSAHGSATELFATVVGQPAFARLDGASVSTLVYALKNQSDQESLAEAEFSMLLAVDWARNAVPASTLADLVAQRLVDPSVAASVLRKVAEAGRYPFFQVDLLLHALESVPANDFRAFVLRLNKDLVPSNLLNALLLRLAEINPHGFATIFLCHRSVFKKAFGPTGNFLFQNEQLVQKACWKKAGMWDKLVATFFPG